MEKAIIYTMKGNVIQKLKKALKGRFKKRVVVTKEVPYEEAKEMVEDFLSKREGMVLYPHAIAEVLGLPYEQVHEIILDLHKEGKVTPADEEE